MLGDLERAMAAEHALVSYAPDEALEMVHRALVIAEFALKVIDSE